MLKRATTADSKSWWLRHNSDLEFASRLCSGLQVRELQECGAIREASTWHSTTSVVQHSTYVSVAADPVTNCCDAYWSTLYGEQELSQLQASQTQQTHPKKKCIPVTLFKTAHLLSLGRTHLELAIGRHAQLNFRILYSANKLKRLNYYLALNTICWTLGVYTASGSVAKLTQASFSTPARSCPRQCSQRE